MNKMTSGVEAVVDGVYTQELFRTEFFGIESQVQDPAAELTLKLIEIEDKTGHGDLV